MQGARAKLARAWDHLDTLDIETTAFVENNPVAIVSEYDAEAQRFTFRMSQPSRPHWRRWGVIIGDVLHEASSALDYVAWQLALRKRLKPDRRTAFPVCLKAGDWESKTTKAMLQHIRPEDRQWIKTRQPYPAPQGERPETHAHAMLRKLSNMDKHQVLHTAFLLPMDVDARPSVIRDIGRVIDMEFFINAPVEDGAEFANASVVLSGPNPYMKVDAHLSIYVGFVGSEYGWMDRGMLFYTLRAILKTVRDTVEEAAARIGPGGQEDPSPSKG
jgi:hypothetical protein